MSRMDKYKENDPVVSRTMKNQEMYKDVYLNNTLIDLDIKKKEEKVVLEEETSNVSYVPKNYNINDYLSRAHENRVVDNAVRSLDNTDCEVEKVKEKKDEISRLIEDIEQKERNEDFFSELMPDEDETIITPPMDDKLDKALDDNLIYEYAFSSEEKVSLDKDFCDMKEEVVIKEESNKLPWIIFFVTLSILILVIVIILIFA